MHVTLVYVTVTDGHVEDFLEATHANHTASVKETGNHRFDVLQSTDAPNQFVLYEAYRSEADALAHKQTKHYATWRAQVADWMAEPRKGIAYTGIYPML